MQAAFTPVRFHSIDVCSSLPHRDQHVWPDAVELFLEGLYEFDDMADAIECYLDGIYDSTTDGANLDDLIRFWRRINFRVNDILDVLVKDVEIKTFGVAV
jgi:hypothetical protein